MSEERGLFKEYIPVWVMPSQKEQLDSLVQNYPEEFKNRSAVVRAAISSYLREFHTREKEGRPFQWREVKQ